MPVIQEGIRSFNNVNHLIGKDYERDIIRLPDSAGKMINFYFSEESYLAAREECREHLPSEMQDLDEYALNVFIPHGNVPAFNGDKLVFYCIKEGEDAKGKLYFENPKHKVFISIFDKDVIEYLRNKNEKINIETKQGSLESRVNLSA